MDMDLAITTTLQCPRRHHDTCTWTKRADECE
jgi:hypothetical protein